MEMTALINFESHSEGRVKSGSTTNVQYNILLPMLFQAAGRYFCLFVIGRRRMEVYWICLILLHKIHQGQPGKKNGSSGWKYINNSRQGDPEPGSFPTLLKNPLPPTPQFFCITLEASLPSIKGYGVRIFHSRLKEKASQSSGQRLGHKFKL